MALRLKALQGLPLASGADALSQPGFYGSGPCQRRQGSAGQGTRPERPRGAACHEPREAVVERRGRCRRALQSFQIQVRASELDGKSTWKESCERGQRRDSAKSAKN